MSSTIAHKTLEEIALPASATACSTVVAVRVHRGLRVRGAEHTRAAPARTRGPAHSAALQVHPLHLQSRRTRAAARPRRFALLCFTFLSATGHCQHTPSHLEHTILYYTILQYTILYYTVQCSRSFCMFVLVAALSSLAKFGASCPDLLNSVLILLQRYEYEYDLRECVFACDCKCKQISCIHYTRLADR